MVRIPSSTASVAVGLKRFALLFAVWLVLTSGAAGALLPGALAAAVATVLSLRLQPADGRLVRPLRVLALAPEFLWVSLLGGIDVAWRALHPHMPIDPGWIRYRTRLPAGAARVALGDEVSLMPGTLAAGTHGDMLYVHCLNRTEAAEKRIAAEEEHIARAIGLQLEETDG